MSTTCPHRRPTTSGEAAHRRGRLAVQRGELVVLPTDTVYGIGADAFDPDAVQALLDAKGRGREMPPPVLISAATTLDALATGVPAYARALVEALLARPADPGLPPAALAAVGPRRHPRHRRGADARPRGRPRAARAHRPAGGQLGQPHRPCPPRPTPTQAEEMLGRRGRVVLDGGPSPAGDGLDHRRRHRDPGPGAAPRRALARATSTRCSSRSAPRSTDEG